MNVSIEGRPPISTRAELLDCAPAVPSHDASVETLELLLEQSRCVNRLLSGQDPDWRVGYLLRGKLLLTAINVVKALETSPAAQSTQVREAQQQLVQREKLARLKQQTYTHVAGAVDDVTESIAEGILWALQARGVQTGDAVQELQALNWSRRNAGVPPRELEKVLHQGQFVVARLLFERDSLFVVAGFGPVTVNGRLDDEVRDTPFSEECRIRLKVAEFVQKFSCQDFLSGEAGDRAADAAVLALESALLKKANR